MDYIVLALETAGNEKTATICSGKENARYYAKYYSSIGYHVKTMLHEDYILEALWKRFSYITIDENENIETDFEQWKSGTNRMDIWQWFDKKHSKGTAWLLENVCC